MRRRANAEQLALVLSTPLAPVIAEAACRGLAIDDSARDVDRRLVGEIGGLIAGLNKALEVAAEAGVDVVIVAHYQPRHDGRKRCVIRGQMRRVALDVVV